MLNQLKATWASMAIASLLLAATGKADTINTSNTFGIYSVPTGKHVDMFGGTVAKFDITGGTVTMYGGTLGGLNTGFSGGSIDIYGGTINNAYFGGYSSTAAYFHVQSAAFNGSPITLVANQNVGLPSSSFGTITGVLVDGHNFSVTVDGDIARPNVLFIQTVPEPASVSLLSLGCIALLARRKR